VDGTQFDNLIKRLSAMPLTRGKALRGLAAGAAALTGVTLATQPGDAKNRHEKEVRICVWSATGGQSKKLDKDKAKKTLRRNACARKGSCSGANPCPTGVPTGTGTGTGIVSPIRRDALPVGSTPVGFACLDNTGCSADLVCFGGTCQACTETPQCRGGQECSIAPGNAGGVCCEAGFGCAGACVPVRCNSLPCNTCDATPGSPTIGTCVSTCNPTTQTCFTGQGTARCCVSAGPTVELCNNATVCCSGGNVCCGGLTGNTCKFPAGVDCGGGNQTTKNGRCCSNLCNATTNLCT
jgi:hypothetical protein